MATSGYTNIGASDQSAGTTTSGSNATGLKIVLTENATIQSISAYVKMNTISDNSSCTIFADSGGVKGSLLVNSAPSSVSTSFGWVVFNFSSPYTASAGVYWLQFNSKGGGGPGTATGVIKYDTGGGTNTSYTLSDVGTATYSTQQFSIYATYTHIGVFNNFQFVRSGNGMSVSERIK